MCETRGPQSGNIFVIDLILQFKERTWDDGNKGLAVTIKGGTPWTDPTIFLPAAGERNGDDLAFDSITGYYWSSSLCLTSSDWGQYAHITDNGSGGVFTDIKYFSRHLGMTVRPVRE